MLPYRSHVLVFFLREADLRGLVLLEFLANFIEWKRAQLFDANDGDLRIELVVRTFLVQIIVGLARAEDDLLDVGRVLCSVALLRVDSLEACTYAPERIDAKRARRAEGLPVIISSNDERHSGRRRSDFGDIITSGLRNGSASCRRRI